MKQLTQYLTEKFKLNSKNVDKHNYHPKDVSELKELIRKLIKERGEDADLNDIDVSEITDMTEAFYDNKLIVANINISKWDVRNVKNMEKMFANQFIFDCDLSEWDVSNVINMKNMFNGCLSFHGKGLENWNVSKVKDMKEMFYNCYKLKIKPKWYKL